MKASDVKKIINDIMTGDELQKLEKFATLYEHRQIKMFETAYKNMVKSYGSYEQIPFIVLMHECKSADILRTVMVLGVE